jgi:hypothetical protein
MKVFLLYIDPGSGNYLVQMIIAAVLGGAYYFKSIWTRIKLFFGVKGKETLPENSEENEG